MDWIMRWDIGGDPNEEPVRRYLGGTVDGVRLRRMTQGAWQAHLIQCGFGKMESKLCAIYIERAKLLEQEVSEAMMRG